MDDKKPYISIGIMAHNEEKNISLLLGKLIKQAEDTTFPFTITVVASGCTDKTDHVVRNYEIKDHRVKLIIEQQRMGKAEAINYFLRQSKGDFLVISSADIIPSDNSLREFINALSDPTVGMVGGRPVPRFSFGIVGLLNNLLWELHHERALCQPKLCEFIAFRNIVNKIPEETAADEASIEALVTQKGFKIKYLPEVIIYNYGPKNLVSFIKQRLRIFVGHLYVKQTMSYKVSTYNIIPLILTVIKYIKKEKKQTLFIIMLICLEIYARSIALFEYYTRNKLYSIWQR